jgi:glycine dehydrogenase subunit 1
MRYLSHTPSDVENMLGVIGRPTLAALFDSIPKKSQFGKALNIGPGLSELELKRELQRLAGTAPRLSFLGAGATQHFVPEIVSQQLMRGEWLTAYTPYQPEASQGTLQAIFEFQTMVASLFGCEVANASMYDGATALAEAMLMACRLRPDAKHILVKRSVHPEYRAVCQSIVGAAGYTISEFDDLGAVKSEGPVAALVYQTPNFFGLLEQQEKLVKWAHDHNALAIAANTEPTAFGLIRSPGRVGADIVVGEGLGFCGHLSLGAPGVGLFASSAHFLRQMPGRLCGQTVDTKGKRGFVLTLSTREQHIRREKATSNICTNHNLMALAFSMSLSLYGKSGFKELAKRNLQKTLYFREQCTAKKIPIAFAGPHFNESVVGFRSEQELGQRLDHLAKLGVFAGVSLARWYKEYAGHLLVSTTELHSDADIDYLVSQLA